jgi:hypothetical protein
MSLTSEELNAELERFPTKEYLHARNTAGRLIALALISIQTPGMGWPSVKPQAASFRVDLSSERIVIDLPITDEAGRVLYHFACRGGRQAYLDSLSEIWVGPMMCTLALGAQTSEQSLLSEDDSAAWFSRGQFRVEELVGDCAKYPEFGVRRSFRLRGFRLDLEAQNVMPDKNGLAKSFTLAVSLVSDPGATTAQAERPGFLDPRQQGRSCKAAVPGQDPRMCRDAGGSWALCKN